MNLYLLLKVSLAFHLAGIAMTAGSALMTYTVYRKFWKEYVVDSVKAKCVLSAASRFTTIGGIGMLILILSGMGMMIATHGGYMNLFWFQAKLVVIALLVLNGILVMQRLRTRLNKLMQDGTENSSIDKMPALK